jgi:hypothetical protein
MIYKDGQIVLCLYLKSHPDIKVRYFVAGHRSCKLLYKYCVDCQVCVYGIDTEPFSMPVNNRFWFNNYQTFSPSVKYFFHKYEKESIPVLNLDFLRRSVKYFQLLP